MLCQVLFLGTPVSQRSSMLLSLIAPYWPTYPLLLRMLPTTKGFLRCVLGSVRLVHRWPIGTLPSGGSVEAKLFPLWLLVVQ